MGKIKKITIFLFVIINLVSFAKIHYAPLHPDLLKKNQYLLRRNISAEQKRNSNYSIKEIQKRSIQNQAKAPVLLIKFSDKENLPSHTKEYYQNLLFGETNSMKEYYQEVSYGKLENITGEISSWVTSDKTMSYYGINDGNPIIKELIKEAVDKVDDEIDFSKYDLDGDGFVDQLIVIHSGQGEEKTGTENDIWSHEWKLDDYLTKDGVKIRNYTIQSEYSPIGIFAHEFGHALGLPDLYGTDENNSGSKIGLYSLMDYGSWAGPDNDGTKPSHFTAWEKILLGWINPTTLTIINNNQLLSIKDVETNDTKSVYRIDLDETKKEYLLIENRQKQEIGYDSYLPGSGLLIYHIYEKDIEGQTLEESFTLNNINSKQPLRVKILEADGYENLGLIKNDEKDGYYGESGDFFRKDINSQLLSYINNNPNSCLWDQNTKDYNIPSGIHITEISSSNNTMQFRCKIGFDIKITDVNNDGEFDIQDIILFKKDYYDENKVEYDFNNDGIINSEDLTLFKERAKIEFENIKIW